MRNRKELHPMLKLVVDEVIKTVDFSILDGSRGRAEQERAFRAGHSKVHFGDSAHNWSPSIAMDLTPYPLDYDNLASFRRLAKAIMAAGKLHAVPLRWGADWDMDGDWKDERFLDWGHFELNPWREWARESNLIKD
jgi:peptidoglycan L-alanyl-D-glutamate endopeptidase CwlK